MNSDSPNRYVWIEEAPGGGCRVAFELPIGETP